MNTYSYTARSKNGDKISGTIEAGETIDAMRRLQNMGLVPITLNEVHTPTQGYVPSLLNNPLRKHMRLLLWGIIALGAIYFISPYWMLYRIKSAVARKDAVYISDRVDFPSLRESVKSTFTAQMAKEVASKETDGFEAFGAALGAMMIGPMVDAFVTPENLIAMMQGRDIDEIQDRSNSSSGSSEQPADADNKMNISKMKYETFNRFIVLIEEAPKYSSGETMTIVFTRNGIYSWKLTGIRVQTK